MKKQLLFTSLLLSCFGLKAQLTITDSLSNTQISTLLQGAGVTVTSLTVNCDGRSLAEFSGTSEMAITHGIALSSGFVDSLANANYGGSTSGGFVTPGDPDLDSLSGTMTYDGCVLEFDCVPVGDTLLFNYCFGSEEYPEFVGSTFNDIFAILISGPGISGTINAATLPGGIPVSINNVNAATNASYFYDNEFPAGQYVSMDGFTTNLTAFAEVIPGSTYHFKVAIADASDGVLDSGVFLEAFSFRSVTADPLGIAKHEDNLFEVYPNPGNGEFFINSKQNNVNGAQLKVVNILGEEVLSQILSSSQTKLDIGNQAPGVYSVSITTANGVYTTRLVKK